MKALNEAWSTLKSPEARRRYDVELGLVEPDTEEFRPEAEPDDEPPPRRSPLRRTGVRLAIVAVLVLGLVGSAVALFSHESDQSDRWSSTAIRELRQAAVGAGMSASQADCFVKTITSRYAPSDAVDPAVIQQTINDCR